MGCHTGTVGSFQGLGFIVMRHSIDQTALFMLIALPAEDNHTFGVHE